MVRLLNALRGYKDDFPLFYDTNNKWFFRYGMQQYGPFESRDAANTAFQLLLQHKENE